LFLNFALANPEKLLGKMAKELPNSKVNLSTCPNFAKRI
jgi:hypothetical protein